MTSAGKAAGGELQRRVPRRTLRRQQRERRLAHPRQARPGGALGLSRGAGPGRGCGVPGPARGAAHALRASTSAPLLAPPRPRSPTPPARSPPFASRAPPLRPSLSLSSPLSQPTSASTPSAPAWPRSSPTAARRAPCTATRSTRPPPVSGSHRVRCARARPRARGSAKEPGALGLARAALAHPRQARPGGALGLSRGAGPGRGCGGGRGRGRGAQPKSPAPLASRAQPSRHVRPRKPSSPPGPAQTPTSSP